MTTPKEVLENICFKQELRIVSIKAKYTVKIVVTIRWSKNARHGNGFEECTKKKKSIRFFMTIRLNGLMKESINVTTLTTNDEDSRKISKRYLFQAKIEISKHKSETYCENYGKDKHKFSSFIDFLTGCKDQVLNLIKKKIK